MKYILIICVYTTNDSFLSNYFSQTAIYCNCLGIKWVHTVSWLVSRRLARTILTLKAQAQLQYLTNWTQKHWSKQSQPISAIIMKNYLSKHMFYT